jgi:hypothetical protein
MEGRSTRTKQHCSIVSLKTASMLYHVGDGFPAQLRGSQAPDVDPHCFLHVPEAVEAEVIIVEPPCDHDDMVPRSLSFGYPKVDRAGSRSRVTLSTQPLVMATALSFWVAMEPK